MKGLRPATLGVLLTSAACLASCGGDGPAALANDSTNVSTNFSSPLAAAESWFHAVNTKNLGAAQDHFLSADRDMMDWGGGDTATWSTFTKLRCKTFTRSARNAIVHCSFNESPSSSEGNPDSFWTITLQKTTANRWLIANYGQG
jgi:hypothetical protein